MDSGRVPARSVTLPLAGNARAKMSDLRDGFVKLFCRPASGLVIGGVVVAPKASELILPIALAVENHLTVSQLAHTITKPGSQAQALTSLAPYLPPDSGPASAVLRVDQGIRRTFRAESRRTLINAGPGAVRGRQMVAPAAMVSRRPR
jgi:hypothetical protein